MSDGETSQELELKPPVGEARELDKLMHKRWREHLLLFSQVKNKVLVINPNVQIPLQLKEGRSSPLGLFAEAGFEKLLELPIRERHTLGVLPEHKRSALLGRVVFADNEGRIYRDIDLKGIGFLASPDYSHTSLAVVSIPGEKHSLGGRRGLLSRETAILDCQLSEEFLQAGIRTSRYLAIIELRELIIEGRKISLQEAREHGVIDEDFHPVIEIRAFGTRVRIRDLRGISHLETKPRVTSRLLLKDAKKLVAQELGKENISTKEYLQWFATTLGRNAGLIHKNGWLHNYLHDHNITLDCRIVDFDGVTELTDEEARSNEIERAKDALTNLIEKATERSYHSLPITGSLLKQFEGSYDSVFPPKERTRYFERARTKAT